MFFRPPEYLEEVRERELEIKAMEESLGTAERCPVCRASSSRPSSPARSARRS
jgi:hypothetical protein